jgi:hypothetical protein
MASPSNAGGFKRKSNDKRKTAFIAAAGKQPPYMTATTLLTFALLM